MLSSEKIARVKTMLAEGFSQRQIAVGLRIGRDQVRAIQSGTRPDYERRRRAEPLRPIRPLEKPTRCSDCGTLVYAPCVACELRSLAVKADSSHSVQPVTAPLGIGLCGDDYERYLDVKRRKRLFKAVHRVVDDSRFVEDDEIELEYRCRAAFQDFVTPNDGD